MTQPRGWKSLETLAASRTRRRRLVPVLGSGFVTQAVLEGARDTGARPRPVDWLELLRGVAKEHGLDRAIAHVARDVPGQTTLLLDAMLVERARRDGASPHRVEADLRRSIARRLRADTATVDLARPFVASFLRLGFEDVLTFNFDDVLLPPGTRPTERVRGRSARASLAAEAGDTTLWFPHGHLSDPSSIVLGAHAYGKRLAVMQAAFDDHARRDDPRPTRGLSTWVATLLERPLLFAGLSLTREEWTVWWLLAQRARFLARRPPARRPHAFIFVRRPAADERLEAHAAFASLARAAELLDAELLAFSDFASGWRKLRRALGWTA